MSEEKANKDPAFFLNFSKKENNQSVDNRDGRRNILWGWS